MGNRTVGLTPEQHKYFNDIDNSILQHSVDLGKVVLQVDTIKVALGTLYQSRAKRLGQILSEGGIDPDTVSGARVTPGGTLDVQFQDPQGPPA